MSKAGNFLLHFCALLLFLTGNFIACKSYKPNFPPITELKPTAQSAALDMAAIALGARRLCADIGLINLFIYYGNERNGKGNANLGNEVYPEFAERAFHIARLDPSFRSANTFSAAILGFNMNKYDDAESLLKYVLIYQPKQRFYTQMLLSIAQKKTGNTVSIIEAILPIVREPDCPPLIKNITALLYRRAGNWQEAEEIYEDMLRTSRELEYVKKAQEGLRDLALVRLGQPDPMFEALNNL